MRLSTLAPRFLAHGTVLAFLCPCCRKTWLHAKNVPMSHKDQFDLFESTYGEHWNMEAVPMKPDTIWTFVGSDLEHISVTPSIDATMSGHWHGYITNGECK